MRSKNRTIEVIARKDITMPLFIELAHRHLVKEMPTTTSARNQDFNVPVDLVRLAAGDAAASTIEEITLGYSKS